MNVAPMSYAKWKLMSVWVEPVSPSETAEVQDFRDGDGRVG
jgi:hypothetical protein